MVSLWNHSAWVSNKCGSPSLPLAVERVDDPTVGGEVGVSNYTGSNNKIRCHRQPVDHGAP